MNSRWKKISWWCFILMAYALMLAAVYAALQEPDLEQRLAELAANASWSQEAGRSSLLISQARREDLQGAMLLPVSAEEESLPGLPEIWRELADDHQRAALTGSSAGFHAMQGVRDPKEFDAGWSAELPLGGVPLEAIRHGNRLFVLTAQRVVQVIACDDPRHPQLQKALPYRSVKHMAERDGLLYLLLGNHKETYAQLVVVSMENALAPQELARHELPRGVVSFFLKEDHLFILQEQLKDVIGGRTTDLVVQRLLLTRKAHLEPLGVVTTPPLGHQFLTYGDYLILNVLYEGLLLVNYRNLSQSDPGITLPLPAPVKHMMLSGSRLYVLGQRGKLSVVDLADPQRPRLVVKEAEVKKVAFLTFFDEVTYYFADNGHMMVFDRVPGSPEQRKGSVPFVANGALQPQVGSDGLVLLGQGEGLRPKLVSEVIQLPEASSLRAGLNWRNQWLVLRDSGLLESYHYDAGGKAVLTDSLQLPPGQRWLKGSAQRLYVGGGREVLVVDKGSDDRLALTGRLPLPVGASWDAAVSRQTLWLAAGPAGLLAFSLTDPDQPHELEMPTLGFLEGLADARQLAVAADGRVFVAAGQAGLLCYGVMSNGLIRLCERLDFQGLVVAVAVIDGVCLVATASEIHVVDVATPESVQKLGSIALRQVERFAVAPPHHWAGLVKGQGWVFLPAPIRLVPEIIKEIDRLKLALPAALPAGKYRVILFNDAGIKPLGDIYEIMSTPEGVTPGVAHGTF